MSENILAAALKEKGFLLADGATGTNLFGMGLQTGDAPELWNVDFPERIRRSEERRVGKECRSRWSPYH